MQPLRTAGGPLSRIAAYSPAAQGGCMVIAVHARSETTRQSRTPATLSRPKRIGDANDQLLDIGKAVGPRRARHVRRQHDVIERQEFIIGAARLLVLHIEA